MSVQPAAKTHWGDVYTKELSESVNVSTYVSVNFEEMEESFKFSNALGARCLNWTDLVSAGWFKGRRTHTHQRHERTHKYTHRVAEQTTSPAHKQV